MSTPPSSESPEPSLKILLTHFKWTIDRFEEILQNEKSDYYRDAALQRFNFTCDMALKCIGSLAAEQEKTCKTFQECVEWSVNNNWLEPDAPWKEIIESYSQAGQKLKGEEADLEYEKMASYCLLLKNIYNHLEVI